MAILDWEGFDRETQNLGIFTEFSANIGTDGTGYGNYGRSAYFNGNNKASRLTSFPNTAILFAQFHVRFNAHADKFIFGLTDDSTFQVFLMILSDGIPRIYRESWSAVLLGSATESLPVNVWLFIQMKVTIANSGGSAELRVQGKPVLSVTGDTQNTNNPHVNGWRIEHFNFNNNVDVDNILLYDTNGDAPNTWTPETRIYDSLPNGAGSTTQWSPSAGANWQCVDEQPSNADTDYVSAAAASLTDTYAAPAVAAPGSIIYAVGVHATARKDDAGANEIDGVLRSGVLDYAHGTPKPLSTSYSRQRWLWSTDPATGLPWTVAGANAAQPGIRRTT